MTATMNKNGNELTVLVEGRLDTLTSPKLEEKLDAEIAGVEKLILDFEKLVYISSAGLRIIAGAMEVMDKQGELIIRNVCPAVYEIMDATGFTDFLNIE